MHFYENAKKYINHFFFLIKTSRQTTNRFHPTYLKRHHRQTCTVINFFFIQSVADDDFRLAPLEFCHCVCLISRSHSVPVVTFLLDIMFKVKI